MNDRALELQRDPWMRLAARLKSDADAAHERERSSHFLGMVLGLAHGARVRKVKLAIAREGLRICSAAVRRHHCLIVSAESALADPIVDQARSLIELTFQAFYLLRTPIPEQAALDAFNLSAIRWARDGQRLVDAGHLADDIVVPKDDPVRSQVEQQVFSRYAKQKPRFYADKTAQQTAKEAGLQRLYELTYSPLSASVHSSPMAAIANTSSVMPGVNLELTAVPSSKLLEKMWTAFAVGSQAAVIAAMGSLATFAEVDSKNARVVLDEFHEAYPNDWEAELHTLAASWGAGQRSD